MLTTAEAAAILGITRTTVLAHIKASNLKAEKHGRDWLIEQTEVDRFKQGRRTSKGSGRKASKVLAISAPAKEGEVIDVLSSGDTLNITFTVTDGKLRGAPEAEIIRKRRLNEEGDGNADR
jgi:excisionase family DNA binding protein